MIFVVNKLDSLDISGEPSLTNDLTGSEHQNSSDTVLFTFALCLLMPRADACLRGTLLGE